MANNNDKRILELRKQIQIKKDKVGKIGNFAPTTNQVLHLDGAVHNINVLGTNKQELLRLYVKLNSYLMSAKDLGVEDEVEYSGFKLEDWISDVSSKLNNLTKKEETMKLVAMESKLEKMLSDEKQVELELDSITALLND